MPGKKINSGKFHASRIGEKFKAELEEIQNTRLINKTDKKIKSIRRLTELIIKHNFWPEIKEDMININLERGAHAE